MFSVLDKLSDEQFTSVIQSSFPSIQETVAHIFGAEWIWLMRWNGTSPRADGPFDTKKLMQKHGVDVEKLRTVSGLRSFADSLEQERQGFLRSLTEDTSARAAALQRQRRQRVFHAAGAALATCRESRDVPSRAGDDVVAAGGRRDRVARHGVFLPGARDVTNGRLHRLLKNSDSSALCRRLKPTQTKNERLKRWPKGQRYPILTRRSRDDYFSSL